MANGLFNLKQVMQAVQQSAWVAQKTPAVEYLVVAGGGGANNGGGGAGGLLQGIDPVPNGQTLLVTVGGGGAGTNSGSAGANGQNSLFSSITSIGGGGGGSQNGASVGQNGGSGGGEGYGRIVHPNYIAGQGVAGQGNAGSLGYSDQTTYTKGGGGGGAGTLSPYAGVNQNGGSGGTGIASSISGTVTAYAGGGGGAPGNSGTGGLGGVGGGGSGVYNGASNSGTANTGGGAGANNQALAGNGGSGIVIVSYPDVYAAATATTGSPTVSTSGSGSILFNASYFAYNGQSSFAFATGDFTIEFWFYALSFSSTPVIYDSRPTGGNGAYAMIYFDGSAPKFYVNTTDAITGSVLSTSTWYHLAVSRSGTVTKMFINGSQVGSSYTDTTNYLNPSARPSVGTNGASLGSNNFGGYISNLRILKGTALYTSNFTVPTAPLTAVTNTQLLLNAVSGAYLADGSTNSYNPPTIGGSPVWNTLSPFTGTGYKNRVYTWTSSGSITF